MTHPHCLQAWTVLGLWTAMDLDYAFGEWLRKALSVSLKANMPLFPTPAWYYAKSLNKSFTCDISKPPFDSLHSTLTSPLNVWSWVVCKKRMKKTNVVHYVSVNWKFQVDKYRVKKNNIYVLFYLLKCMYSSLPIPVTVKIYVRDQKCSYTVSCRCHFVSYAMRLWCVIPRAS